MQNRTNLTAEKRVKEIIANWPESGFNVAQLLDALLADDKLCSITQGRNGAIIFRSKNVANAERTALMRAIFDATKSPAFTQQEAIRRKAVTILTSTVDFHNVNSNIGTSVFKHESSPELRNTYVKTVFTILETCELTADEYVMLLTGPVCKGENDRPYILAVELAENHDRENLAAYFDTLTRLIDEGKINQTTYERIHQQFSKHKFTNYMIKAYARNPDSSHSASSVDAMMKYLTFMSKVRGKFGLEFNTTLNEESLGYLREHIPKESIFAELTKKRLADCSLEELRVRFTNLECARNARHPLGCILHIRRGWTKVDENSGTLAEIKYAYHRTGKEIFFRDLEDLTLSQQLKRCESALINTTDEYRTLSRATHPDQLHDTPEHGETRKRLADKIQDIREKLEQYGEQPISPTAPPKTLEIGNECQSQVGRDLTELHELAKNTALPHFKKAFANFKSASVIDDAKFACELFEGEAAKEIILARRPQLTIKFLATLHSIAAVNPDFAVRVGFILGQIRNNPDDNIQRNLMHNMFNPTFSRYEHNSIEQLLPLLSLLRFLRGSPPISAQGVNSLLGIKSGEGAVFAMTVISSFSIEGILAFIHFLSEACDSKENARDIANMLTATYNNKNTFELLLSTTKNTEVVLAFLMLLDKIINERDLQIRLDKLMPNDIDAYGYDIKYKILNHVKAIKDRKDCNIFDLGFVNRVCHAALDENQPLGKIIHIQRDITKVSLEKGSLQEFAKLLQETEEQFKVREAAFRVENIATQQDLPLHDELSKQPPAEVFVHEAPPPAYADCAGATSDTLFNHKYLQLGANLASADQAVEVQVVAQEKPQIVTSIVEAKVERKPESPRSTLDIAFGMNNDASEVLQPRTAETTTGIKTGNLIDFDSPIGEMRISDQYASQLSDIDFSAPIIVENVPLSAAEDKSIAEAKETDEEREKRIERELANLPPAPRADKQQGNHDKEKKDDQPKVLAYAK